ncbi:hypothetical protein MMC28_002120 [Mycoblastus sanguinarius]|nr:hypothetical protein [Mycoblastus sanguinarius]
MVQHHSTLELVRHDETARAPELYNNVPASELDTTCLAPQVQSEVTPQVFYSTSLPEAHGNIENSKERDPSQSHTKIAFKWSWIVIAFVVAAAIALGTGLGIWHNREHSSHHVSTTSPSAPPNPNTTTLNTTNPSIAPAQYILNDTSLEAAILPNGDRHLFFQDSTGLIRRAIRSASTNSWNTGLHLSISSNAKNYTPLAVTVAAGEGLGYGDNSQRIQLFYVSENDRLNSKYFVDGSWSTELSLENYTTAENTRQLSVTLVNNTLNNPGDPSNTVLTSVPMTNTNLGLSTNITTAAVTALLLFENSIGNVTALANIAVRCTMSSLCKNQTLNEWVDISSQRTTSLLEFDVKSLGDFPVTLYESAPEATFSAPFTSGRSLYYDRDQLSRFQALFYMASDASSIAGSATRNGFISTDWYFTPSNGSEGFDSRMIADTNSSISPYSIHQSDIALIGSSSEYEFREYDFREYDFREYDFREYDFREYDFREYDFRVYDFREYDFREYEFREYE